MELNVSIFISGVLKGTRKVGTPCLIGRSKDAGLTVAHPAMSRKHCELYEDAGKLYLRDNSSLNGTLFKGEYVENPVCLSFGDEFTVGELMFRVTSPETVSREERQAIADRPTAALATEAPTAAGDDQAGMMTVLEPPKKPVPEQKPPAKKSKDGKKVSPKDVKISLD